MKKNSGILTFFLSIFIFGFLIFKPAFSQDASLLPNAVQQFFDSSGNPLAGGKVYFYQVGTSAFKDVYNSSAATTPYTNPITLNAGGKPPGGSGIYGIGLYRQLVKDKNGNTIWDAVTAPGGGGGGTPTGVGDGNAVGTVLPWSGLTAPSQYVFAYGQELVRSSYPEFYSAITLQTNVICTASSNTLTGIADTSQIPVGSPVELSLCVPPGSTVISKTSGTVTLNNPANVSLNATARFFPYGNGNGSTTFNVPDLRDMVLVGRPNMGGTDRGLITSQYFGIDPAGLGAVGGVQTATLSTSNLPPYTPTGAISLSTVDTVYGNLTTGLNIQAGSTNPGAYNPTNIISQLSGVFIGEPQGGTMSPFSVIQPSITFNYIIKVIPDTPMSTETVVTELGGMTGVITCGTGLTCADQTISVNSFGEATTAIKIPVKAATTANIGLFGPQTIDGVSVIAGDRVLVKDQVTASENGIYVVSNSNWTRATDFNEDGEIVQGTQVFVNLGNINSNLIFYILTSNPLSIGSAINFQNLAYQPSFKTTSDAQNFNIPASVKSILIQGYYTIGVGSGIWKRVDAEPSFTYGKFRSQDRYLSNGSIDPINGGWWQIGNTEEKIDISSIGAISGDTDANGNVNGDVLSSAVSIAVAQGGGKIYVPAGTYVTCGTIINPGSGILLKDNMTLEGADTNASILKRCSTANLSVINISGGTNISVRNITADGNWTIGGALGVHCLRVGDDGVDGLRIDNVYLHHCHTYGLGIQGDPAINKNILVSNLRIYYTGADGIDHKNRQAGNYGLEYNNIIIEDPAMRLTSGDDFAGFDIRGVLHATNVTVRALNTQVPSGATLTLIRFRQSDTVITDHLGGRKATLTGFYAEGPPTAQSGVVYGIYVADPYVQITNGVVYNANRSFTSISQYARFANVTSLDAGTYGFVFGTSGSFRGDYNACVSCSALWVTAPGGTAGFRFASANAIVTNPTVVNGTLGIDNDATATNTVIVGKETYTGNTTNVSNGAGAINLTRPWDAGENGVVDFASAGTVNIGQSISSSSREVRITGTTTITSFGTAPAGRYREGYFAGALTLIHNNTSLILPGAANITTSANDRFGALSLGSGNWIVLWYTKSNGEPLVYSPNLSAVNALSGTGLAVRTSSTPTWALRSVDGTANEVMVTNGDGVSGNPTISLPSALTFSGKIVSGGTFDGSTITKNIINGSYSLPCVNTQQSLTGSTSETALASIQVPANTILANGSATITILSNRNSGGAGAVTFRVRFGSANDLSGTIMITAATGTSNQMHNFQTTIYNRNAANSQIANGIGTAGGWGVGSSPPTTSSIDTTNTSYIVISGQLANSSDTAYLEACSVKINARN